MAHHFVTGFPGLLATALVERLLGDGHARSLTCLVHPSQAAAAEVRRARLDAAHPGTREKIRLLEGDLVQPGLGLAGHHGDGLRDVSVVHHLAAVYDLSVPASVGEAVNVEGTRHVLGLCRRLPALEALNHVSTCYVAGDRAAGFREQDLDEGQRFHNHYEATKQRSEVLVREAMARGLPARIFRPAVVVGDASDGATAKYDGLYFVIRFLMRWQRIAPLGVPFGAGRARFNAVPRDWLVGAMCALAADPSTLGGTFQLADATPPRVPELLAAAGHAIGVRVLAVPVPLAPTRLLLRAVPAVHRWMGIPPEAIDYFTHPGTFDNRATLAALATLPEPYPPPPTLLDYLPKLVDFVRRYPDAPPSV